MKNKKFLWLLFALATILALILLPGKTVSYQKDETIIPKEEFHIVEVVYAEEKDSLDRWIDRLAVFECDGCGPNYRRLDLNHRYSYSCLQFQEATFREMVRLYDNGLPEDEYWERIYDCTYQKQLARQIIKDQGAEKAGKLWYTSIHKRGLGLPPEI